MSSKQEAQRKRVYEFYLANRSQGKIFTVNHFKAENFARRTIYNIIERAEHDSGHERVKGSGRIAKKMKKKDVKRIKNMFDHRDAVSQSQAARKFDCTQQYISKTLRTKTSIRLRKKKTIPKRTDDQRARARPRCGRLYAKLQTKACIIDDESYFTLAHSTINGNGNFYTSQVSDTPASVKYQPKAKFEVKMLVYLCFSEKGISKPFFVPSGLAVNQHIYLEDCIKKILVPFINEHHSDGEYLFWPDLASAHYANSVIDFLKAQNLNFVEKLDNPPNVPECRPIEDFWSILKGKVYERNWQAKNLDHLKKRIKICLGKIDLKLIQDLSKSVLRRVDNVRRNGVIEQN